MRHKIFYIPENCECLHETIFNFFFHRYIIQVTMEEFQEFFSKIVLISSFEMDLAAITNKNVSLQIDAAYKIGRSIAVLLDEQVIGHLTRSASRSIWMQLKFGHRLEATVYGTLENGFQNKIQFSMLTKSLELGVCIRCFFHDCFDGTRRISGNTDAKLFLAYVLKHRLNCFPGVTVSNCPPSLLHFM